jgi:hypothetical protein
MVESDADEDAEQIRGLASGGLHQRRSSQNWSKGVFGDAEATPEAEPKRDGGARLAEELAELPGRAEVIVAGDAAAWDGQGLDLGAKRKLPGMVDGEGARNDVLAEEVGNGARGGVL